MKKTLFLLLSTGLFLSCEKEVHIPIEYTESKLVVNGLFNNDSLWEVEISASQYIYDNGPIPLIDDASVSITNSAGNTITLLNQSAGIYTSASEKPQTGQEYTINVSHGNYKNASSSNQLPGELVILNMDWQQQTVVDGEVYRKINITLQDSPEDDYYMIRIAANYWIEVWNPVTWQVDSVFGYYPLRFMTQSPAVENINPKDEVSSINFTDNLFNGSQYTIDLLLNDYYFDGGKEEIEVIYISTSKISKEYYWYLTSYQAYISSQNNQFFSQPVQVYTNIENGLGIFAGYTTKTDSIIIP